MSPFHRLHDTADEATVEQHIRRAAARVADAFPIAGYVGRGFTETTAQLASLIVRASPPPATLLDIGSGPMDKTAVFARLGYSCSAADDLSDPWHLRDGMRDRIESFAAAEGIQFRRGPCDPVPVTRGGDPFDIVTLFEVLEHLHTSPRELLNVAGNALKTGGLLCVTLPNAVNARKRISVLLGRSNYPPVEQVFWTPGEWRGHIREYTRAEAHFVCARAGFEVLKSGWFEMNAYERFAPLPALLFHAFASVFAPGLMSGVYVLARKPPGWRSVAADVDEFRRAISGSVPAAVR